MIIQRGVNNVGSVMEGRSTPIRVDVQNEDVAAVEALPYPAPSTMRRVLREGAYGGGNGGSPHSATPG